MTASPAPEASPRMSGDARGLRRRHWSFTPPSERAAPTMSPAHHATQPQVEHVGVDGPGERAVAHEQAQRHRADEGERQESNREPSTP
jgi:hypothetical protein